MSYNPQLSQNGPALMTNTLNCVIGEHNYILIKTDNHYEVSPVQPD